MSNPEILKDLLTTILSLQRKLAESDRERIRAAQEAYRELLDDFYEEYRDMMAPQQYEGAKNDPNYFIALIQLAYYHEGQSIVEGEQSSSNPDWKLFTRC